MANVERVREVLAGDPGPDYWQRKQEEGWTLAAVEWSRPRRTDAPDPLALGDGVPYGLRVASDCAHLEPDPEEQKALIALLSLLIDDGLSLSRVADVMNQRGFRTREGAAWSQKAVFELLPRVVEASPMVLESPAWVHQKGTGS